MKDHESPFVKNEMTASEEEEQENLDKELQDEFNMENSLDERVTGDDLLRRLRSDETHYVKLSPGKLSLVASS